MLDTRNKAAMDCSDGAIDNETLGVPLIAVGLYATGATLVCAAAMLVDVVLGFRSKQYWIPNNYASINAASISMVAVASKLVMDSNSPMPSKLDQLVKLSTTTFICVALINFQPSLGKLEKGELIASNIALVMLVLYAIADQIISMVVGVIYGYVPANILMLVIMGLVLYDSVVISAYLPILKNYLHLRFEGRHQLERVDIYNGKKLRQYLMRYSIMAQSGCPHFVMARSSRSFSLAVLSLISASTFFFVLFATVTHRDGFLYSKICFGDSDYAWSQYSTLIAQAVAIAMGLVTPISRYIYLIRAIEGGEQSSPSKKKPEEEEAKEEEEEEEEEEFWMRHLEVSKEKPMFSYVEERERRPIVYKMKSLFLHFLSIHKLHFLYESINNTILYIISRKCCSVKDLTPAFVHEDFIPDERKDLATYFLYVKGEERLIKLMEKNCSTITQRYIDTGKRKNPRNLVEFLREHLSCDFRGVASFADEEVIPPLLACSETPPNCWSLIVLTLTSVAIALPNVDPTFKERLMKSVNEGLVYVKLVEDQMNSQHKFVNIRASANIVWQGLDRQCSWLDINLQVLALKATNSKEVLIHLADFAKQCFSKFTDYNRRGQKRKQKTSLINMVIGSLMGMVSKVCSESEMVRTCKAVAAYSMYRICQTMLQQQEEGCQDESSDVAFKKLCITIADILGACFTNLKPCIVSICDRCSMEERRDTAFRMLKVFGEIEEIMEMLAEEGRNIPDVPSDERGLIDKWRFYISNTKGFE